MDGCKDIKSYLDLYRVPCANWSRQGAVARSDVSNADDPKTRSEGYLSGINPEMINQIMQMRRCQARFFSL